MTILDVYIGRLSDGPDPLDWGRDPRIGNTPARIGPFFPPSAPFYRLLRQIEAGKLDGKQVDWGAHAANVSKQDIVAFIDEHYRGDRTYTDPDYMPHLYPQMGVLLDFVNALPEGRYALVASEL